MWFKQVQLFQLTSPVAYDAENLDKRLANLAFTPCLPSLASSHGWYPPIGNKDAPLVHPANGYLMICLQCEDKILPAPVLRQAVQDKVQEIEHEDDRRVGQKEKRALKDDITQTLLPRAFSKFTPVYAYIDTNKNLLAVNTTNASKLKAFTMLFERAVSGVKLKPFSIKKVTPLMTQWLIDPAYIPEGFSIAKHAVLQDANQQNRVIRCQQQDLFAESIQSLIKDGCSVKQMALNWQEQVDFVLNEDFTLRSISFSDEIVKLAQDDVSETAAQAFDADFAIMSSTFKKLFNDLLAFFAKEVDVKEEALEEAVA